MYGFVILVLLVIDQLEVELQFNIVRGHDVNAFSLFIMPNLTG